MVSQTRVREAAEDLVQWRYGVGTKNTATTAGEDMRDWQLGGDRVSAAKKAVQRTKPNTPNPSIRQDKPREDKASALDRYVQKKTDEDFVKYSDPQYYKQEIKVLREKLSTHDKLIKSGRKRGIQGTLSVREEKRAKENLKRFSQRLNIVEEWLSNGGVKSGSYPSFINPLNGKPSKEAINLVAAR